MTVLWSAVISRVTKQLLRDRRVPILNLNVPDPRRVPIWWWTQQTQKMSMLFVQEKIRVKEQEQQSIVEVEYAICSLLAKRVELMLKLILI